MFECFMLPHLMIFGAAVIGGFLIVHWARDEPKQLPSWRWGDAPRRTAKAGPELIEHTLGLFTAGFAAVYTLNYPPCG
jgi:hypothetical protein